MLKSLSPFLDCKVTHPCFHLVLIVFQYLIHLEIIWCKLDCLVQFYHLVNGYPVVPTLLFIYLFIYLFCLFVFSRTTPTAYGGSLARGLIGAVAAGLHQSHSNAGSKPVCDLHHNSQQCRILNPLSQARDRTCNLMVPSQIR